MKKQLWLAAFSLFSSAFGFTQNNSFPTPSGPVGVGTDQPTRQLNVRQISGTNKGILLSGDEYYQSGNGDANGVLLLLGVNRSGNRQLWLGDNLSLGLTTNGFFRYQTGNPLPSIDAVAGNGVIRFPVNIGTNTSNTAIGFEYTGATGTILPASRLTVNGNLAIGNSYISSAAPANGMLVQGNVGIGTTTPIAKLEARGMIFSTNVSNATGVYLSADAGSFGLIQATNHTNNAAKDLIFQHYGGNVGIGTTNPGSFKLAVEGNIGARKLIVKQSSWADYVFEPNYHLPLLKDVEVFIRTHKHLPGVPSAKQIQEQGLDVGDNQATLLKKIEELTLYIIELNKRLEEQKATIEQMAKMIEENRNTIKK